MSSIRLLLIAILVKFSNCSVITTETPTTTILANLPTPWYPWFVRKNAANVCILAKFGAQFIIKDKWFSDNMIFMPRIANVTGYCGDEEQIIHLMFESNNLVLTFKRDNDFIFVNNITFSYLIPNSIVKTVYHEKKVFITPKKFGYKCFSLQTIEMNSFDYKINVTMKIMNTKLEAFRTGNYNYTNQESIEPEQWERVGQKCKEDMIKTDAWKITGISLGVGIAVLGIITLVAIWSARRQENIMLKIKLQRQWTLDGSRQNIINNSSNTSSQNICGDIKQNTNSFNHQRY